MSRGRNSLCACFLVNVSNGFKLFPFLLETKMSLGQDHMKCKRLIWIQVMSDLISVALSISHSFKVWSIFEIRQVCGTRFFVVHQKQKTGRSKRALFSYWRVSWCVWVVKIWLSLFDASSFDECLLTLHLSFVYLLLSLFSVFATVLELSLGVATGLDVNVLY